MCNIYIYTSVNMYTYMWVCMWHLFSASQVCAAQLWHAPYVNMATCTFMYIYIRRGIHIHVYMWYIYLYMFISIYKEREKEIRSDMLFTAWRNKPQIKNVWRQPVPMSSFNRGWWSWRCVPTGIKCHICFRKAQVGLHRQSIGYRCVYIYIYIFTYWYMYYKNANKYTFMYIKTFVFLYMYIYIYVKGGRRRRRHRCYNNYLLYIAYWLPLMPISMMAEHMGIRGNQ